MIERFAQLDERIPNGPGGRYYGVFPAVVQDIADPDSQGRVKVKLPWSPDASGGSGDGYVVWARLATMMAGSNRGSWFVPDVDDEVLLAFECGDPRRPYVIGMLWNGQDSPPEQMDGGGNNYIKAIHSRNGIIITMDDTDGAEKLTLETPAGQKIEIDDGGQSITLTDVTQNSIKMDSSGITVTASAQVKVNAGTVEIDAGSVTVNAGMSTFNGVVKADTVITNSVVSSSYTPGAGNIW